MRLYLFTPVFWLLATVATAQDWNFSLTATNETCFDVGDGSIDVTLTGNTTGFVFVYELYAMDDLLTSIDSGQVGLSNPEMNGFLDDGEYMVVVTKDSTTETRQRTVTVVGATEALQVTKMVTAQNQCNGGSAGAVQVSVTGGSGIYEYGLGSGASSTGPNFTDGYTDNEGLFEELSSRTYRVWVRDSYGCVAGNISGDYTITQPDAITIVYDTINASCSNVGGEIIITSITGGTPFATSTSGDFNYEIQWLDSVGVEIEGSSNQSSLSGLESGQYSVIITDVNECTGSTQFDIYSGFNFALVDQQDLTCQNADDGFIQVRLDTDSENDEEPFEVRIYDGEGEEIVSLRKTDVEVGTATFENLGPDTYTVRAFASTGCTRDLSATLSAPSSPLLESVSSTPAICKDEATGTVTLDGSGGSGTLRYSIFGTATASGSDFSSSTLRTGLFEGTYHIWLKDDTDCEIYGGTIYVGEPEKKWALVQDSRSDVTCNGDGDGSFSFSFDPTLDTDPIVTDENIVWKNVDTGEVIATGIFQKNDLEEGSYVVEVTANSGCVRTLNFDIAEPATLTILGEAPRFDCPLSSSGASTVQIVTTVIGGNDGYTYLWRKNINDALTAEVTADSTISNITVDATYTLYVEDAKGCETSRSFAVEIPDEFEITVNSAVNIACQGDESGSIDVSVTGGTPLSGGSYLYQWTKEGSTAVVSRSSSPSGLGAGKYTLIISDNNGCNPSSSLQVTLTEPSTSYSLSGEAKPITCNGDANGSIDITISRDNGGTLHPNPTTIEWVKDGDAYSSGSPDLTNLGVGEYTITTIDEYSCEQSLTFEIDEFPELKINAVAISNVCPNEFDGEITINPFGGYLGGNSDYTIRWKKGGVNLITGVSADKLSARNLSDGIYNIQVTDSIGCVQDTTITLSSPEPISATATIEPVRCVGEETGYIELDISGGSSPYDILWRQDDASGAGISAEDSIYNLAPGDYYLVINDANGCPSFINTYTIAEPTTGYTIDLIAQEIICDDENSGSISLSVSPDPGHPDGYDVTWYRNGIVYAVETGASAAVSPVISDLDSAMYSVTVSDANGCVKEASYQMVDPDPIYFRAVVRDVTCNNGTDGRVIIDPRGGYSGFTVQYSNSTLGALTDTDFDLGNIAGGRYTITLTDARGCEVDSVVQVGNPDAVVITTSLTNPKCAAGSDGAIDAAITNGTTPYQLEWSDGTSLISTAENISGLAAGSYELTVTDANLCEVSASYVLTDPPSSYEINGDIHRVVCNDDLNGAIDATIVVTGSPLTYDVFWNKDGTLFSQNGEDLNGIGAGTYEIVVEDQYGCVKSRGFTLENPSLLQIQANVDDVSCYQGTDGTVSVQISGGYGNYAYSWKKDNVDMGATSSFVTNQEAAFYTVQVTDDEGCTASRTMEIDEPLPFQVAVTSENNVCATPYDSKIDATISGGVLPYTLQWMQDGLPFSTDEDLSGVQAGTYQLVATDSNFCRTTSSSVVITSPDPLGITFLSFEDNLCPTTETGSFSVQGTGGQFPYLFAFDSGAYGAVNNFVNLPSGEYSLSVQDDVGCTYHTLVEVDDQYNLDAAFSYETDAFAIDFPITLEDGSLGEGIVKWFWDFGNTLASQEQNTSVTYQAPGTYVIRLTVENEVGCRLSATDTLEIIKGFNFTVPTAFSPNNDGLNDTFRPVTENVTDIQLYVQDRNGQIVFESNQLSPSWDGTFRGIPAPQGAYYYEVVYTTKSGKERSQSGKVVLIR